MGEIIPFVKSAIIQIYMPNYLKTLLLLTILSLLLIFVGELLGGREGLVYAFLMSLVINVGAYFFSAKIALASSGAKPVSRNEAPELFKMVTELASKMRLPTPKLYLIPSQQANAFATGRSPEHAAVAVTQGIVETLDKDELRAVLAHELSHVQNRDILIASIAAVLASTIAFISRMGLYSHYGDRDRENSNSGLSLLLALLAPLAATIVQLAVSRNREYEADESAAETLRTGKSLARALAKIHQSVKKLPEREMNPAFSSLYIDNPVAGVGSTLLNLFSTHPPVTERIKRLESLRF